MKSDKKILVAFILNFCFSIFELIGGIFTNSIAIISDSIHDLGDSISIGISYILEKISKKKPNNKYTYGYIRYSVLGSVITTVILLSGSLIVIYNAVLRLINQVDVNYDGMILFALFGMVVNFLAAYFTREGNSLNQKAINLHMLEDVLGWVVVLIGAIVMKFTDIRIIDPILSIFVALFVFIHASRNFHEELNLFLEKTPTNINIEKIKNDIMSINDIKDVHHIHVWSLDGYNNCCTLHIVTDNNTKETKDKVRHILKENNIIHVTIEIEKTDEKCYNIECDVNNEDCKHCHHHH